MPNPCTLDPATTTTTKTTTTTTAMLAPAGLRKGGVPVFRSRIPYAWLQHLCFATVVCIFVAGVAVWHLTAPAQSPNKLPTAQQHEHHWQRYARLTRFYGGVRSLAREDQYVPEYAGNGTELQAGSRGFGGPEKEQHESGEQSGPSMSAVVWDPYSEANPGHDYRCPCPLVLGGINDGGGSGKGRRHANASVPPLLYYPGRPTGFPQAPIGSNAVLGIKDENICLDRYGRLGPYGLGYRQDYGGTGAAVMGGDTAGMDAVWATVPPVDYRRVRWGETQETCVRLNERRRRELLEQHRNASVTGTATVPAPPPAKRPRTVILLRTWVGFEYTAETLLYLRSLIAETSLHSGGEYRVHFLVQVKDTELPIWADEALYNRTLAEALPREFAGMGTLWTERQMELIYPGLQQVNPRRSVYGVYRSSFMPVQWWAHQQRGGRGEELDFVWNWEMDIRYTGHWYELFERTARWASRQPRRELWERSERYYVPAVHGSWEEFRTRVREQIKEPLLSGTDLVDSLEQLAGRRSGHQGSVDANQTAQEQRARAAHTVWGPERPGDSDSDAAPTLTSGRPSAGSA
ncbi:hypothetical protein KEM52_001190 [Ascosphaera acerosa]|nr:hypothetical protein KEM52_001190 [Ascosphaera acerosa]